MNASVVELDAVESRAYHELRTDAVVVHRSARMRMTFSGGKAKEALGGLLTNDVAALTPGQGHRAVALTPKGRVIALVRVMERGADVLVDADAAAGPGFISMIRKYVNPRLAKYVDITASSRCIGIYGPNSAAKLASALASGADASGADALTSLGDHGSLTIGTGDDAVFIVRSGDFGGDGFDCIAGADRIAALETALTAVGLSRADASVATIARIEAGVPEWGVEMDDETIPQEANLDALGAISFNKGCYTGQEVVARIHFRGHVNRHLRWLSADESLPVHANVFDAEGKEVGTVRSSVVSPVRGALAIAMVRREVEPGSEVLVRDNAHDNAHDNAREIRARCDAIG